MDLTDLMETGPLPLLKSPPELMATNRPGLSVAASTAWSPTCSDKPSATFDAFPLATTANATVHTRREDIAFGKEDTRMGPDLSSGGDDDFQRGNRGVNTSHPPHQAGGSCEIFDGDTRKGIDYSSGEG